ncbi:hypothetical protein C8J56DRAFT_394862 [Mycena floridula]|nr:hypothetical protein C8J56DRAFT_394862 [Mycena floridula]
MISLQDAQLVLERHHPEPPYVVRKVTEIPNRGFSSTKGQQTYILDLCLQANESPASHSCFLTVSLPADRAIISSAAYRPNSLLLVSKIISLIHDRSSIPIANSTLDISREILPNDFLITPPTNVTSSSILSLSQARQQSLLTEPQLVLVELQIGRFLGELHSGVVNDWYGLFEESDPRDPSYSWQETFTSLFDSLLIDLESKTDGNELPFTEIRQYMSRAIAYFVFDDVEVPSLVWFSGSEDDLYLTLKSDTTGGNSASISAILPNVPHALWGDPLLESFFLPPGPSKAMLEGYIHGGGENLLVLPRQKTKRIWYTMFLALVVLLEHDDEERRRWGFDTLKECTSMLKSATFL